jgi:hypothetical protein
MLVKIFSKIWEQDKNNLCPCRLLDPSAGNKPENELPRGIKDRNTQELHSKLRGIHNPRKRDKADYRLTGAPINEKINTSPILLNY